MKKSQINRVSFANSYKKEETNNLLKELTLDEIKSVVDFNNKEILLNIINTKFTKRNCKKLYKFE